MLDTAVLGWVLTERLKVTSSRFGKVAWCGCRQVTNVIDVRLGRVLGAGMVMSLISTSLDRYWVWLEMSLVLGI